jgi:NADPH:quinone reductase
VPTAWLSEKPSGLSMEQAASVGVPYLAAWQSLVRAGKLQEGEHVLITGAGGAVGWAAIQIAHWKKAFVIGADMTDAVTAADVLINTQHNDLVDEVHRLTNGKGVDLILDTVGGPLFEPCIRCLAVDGRQVAIASPGSPRVEFDLNEFFHKRAQLCGVNTMMMTGAEIAGILDQLRVGFENGHLHAPEIPVSSFEQALAAYRDAAGRKGYWRRVLKFESDRFAS